MSTNPYTLPPGSIPGGSSAQPPTGAVGTYNNGSQQPYTYTGGGTGGNTITSSNVAQMDPSAFQYGGSAGAANNLAGQYVATGQQFLNQSAPTIDTTQVNNPYATGGRADFGAALGNLNNTAGQYGNLANFYTGMVNGTGPNLATAQLNAANQSNLNNAAALANSGRGGLGNAAGQAAAQNQAAQIGQQNAQQSVATNIQQQELGASGLAGALGGQAGAYGQAAGLAGQQENFNQGAAQYQAGLNNQVNMQNAANLIAQHGQNIQGFLGAGGLGNQIQNSQLNAGIAGQQLQSSNYNTAQAAANQGAQFNAQQNSNAFNNFVSGLGSAVGSFLSFDADLVEPNKPADQMAHWTLREEPDFLLAINQRTGELRKLATQPLTPEEHRQAVNRPHGAGPLGADDPRRMHMNYHDYSIPGVVQDPSAMAMPPAVQPMTGAGSYDAGATDNPFAAGNPITNGQPAAMPGQAAPQSKKGGNYFRSMFSGFGGAGGGMMFHDLELGPGKGGVWNDAPVGPEPWDAPVRDPWEAPSLAGLGVGDQGSAQALAAPTAPLAAQAAAASDPLKAALWRGEVSPQQYDAIKAGNAPQAPPPTAAAALGPVRAEAKPEVTFKGAGPEGEGGASGAPAISRLSLPAGGPARTVWQPTIAPDEFAALKGATQDQIAAADEMQRAQVHQAEDAGIAHMLKAKKLADQQQEMADLRTRNNKEVKGIEDHIADLSDEVADAKIDPEHFWHSQSTGNKIRYGIASMFGAFGAAFSKNGQNVALEQINAKINRDLEEQKAQIERKKGKIGDAQGLLASAYRRTGNMEQAMAAAHAVALQQVDEEQQAYAASSNSETAAAQAQKNSADIRANVAERIASHEKGVQVGGGGGIDLAKVNKLVFDTMQDRIKAGQPVGPEIEAQERQRIISNLYGTGVAGGGSVGLPQKGGLGAGGGRLLRNVPTLQTNDQQLAQLAALESKRYMTSEEKDQAAAIRKALGEAAPTEQGWWERVFGGTGGAAAKATRKANKQKLGHTLDAINSGAPGDDGEGEAGDTGGDFEK